MVTASVVWWGNQKDLIRAAGRFFRHPLPENLLGDRCPSRFFTLTGRPALGAVCEIARPAAPVAQIGVDAVATSAKLPARIFSH
jgi:hypothetical protein